jgi:hypothetical protein
MFSYMPVLGNEGAECRQQEITAIKEYREALITDLVTGKRSLPLS